MKTSLNMSVLVIAITVIVVVIVLYQNQGPNKWTQMAQNQYTVDTLNDGIIMLYQNQGHNNWTQMAQNQYTIETLNDSIISKGIHDPPPMFAAILEYQGQQANGIVSLSSFQCMLPSIYKNSYILEPQIKKSRMRSLIQDSLYFSSFFDLKYFNAQSRKMAYSEIIKEESFFESSPRHIIYVIVKLDGGVQRVLWKAQDHNISCLQSKDIQSLHSGYLKNKENMLLHGMHMKHKCIVKVIELQTFNMQHFKVQWNESVKHKQELHDFIFEKWSPHEVTLLFNYWSFLTHVPGTMCNLTEFHLKPSTELMDKAKKYEEKFLGERSRLAIMIRIERIVTQAHSHKTSEVTFIKECLQKTLSLRRKATGNSTDIVPFVTLDVGGHYGTDSYRGSKAVTSLARNMITTLYNGSWTMSEWEKSFIQVADGVTDRGYIAALQRILASRADCLIMAGGGDFQGLARNGYKYYHNSSSNCVFSVCDERPKKL